MLTLQQLRAALTALIVLMTNPCFFSFYLYFHTFLRYISVLFYIDSHNDYGKAIKHVLL